MKWVITFLCIIGIGLVQAQTTLSEKYTKADELVKAKEYKNAYTVLKEIYPQCDKDDTLYSYIVWYYTSMTSELERQERMKENWQQALDYGLEALSIIKVGNGIFDEKYSAREYWMCKNVIISYVGLGQLDKAMEYRAKLYSAYKSKLLPDGIDKYYNFEFFRWENKNVWGYEWFPELGDPESQGSFSKIVYYVYSTNPDGSDKDQLYRLHVLKFHKLSENSVDFDYVLTKRLETAKNEVSGTLYAYTYKKELDFPKIRADIREVLKGNYEPNTKSVVNKKEK